MDRIRAKIYAFGSNGAGQLGVGHSDDLRHPQICRFKVQSDEQKHTNDIVSEHLPGGDSVKTLAAGGNHTLILTQKGRVFAAGNNCNGRCGIGSALEHLNVFTAIPWALDKAITHLAASWEASFFVVESRTIWTCGRGLKGELGLGEVIDHASSPEKVFDTNLFTKDCTIAEIAAGMSHVIIVLSDGQVFGWGSSRRGQLGHANIKTKVVWAPQQLELSVAATKVVCGRDFSVVRGSKQECILLGQLKAIDGIPSIIPNEDADLVAGWTTIYVLDNGTVSGFGHGQRGQLPPVGVPPVVKLAAGSEHCVGLTETGEVICWGWGEHGNCGLPTDERSNVHGRFNRIKAPANHGHNVSGIGAGCATSFLYTSHCG